MIAGCIEIPLTSSAEWAPRPDFAENPVARDGRDNGREAETGE
jgi:hypothetical protein